MRLTLFLAAALCVIGCDNAAFISGVPASQPAVPPQVAKKLKPNADNKVKLTDAEWKQILTADQYYILREKGTEPSFRNAYFHNETPGVYQCAGCGQALFTSDQKYDSQTGWPSFWQPVKATAVVKSTDADGSRDEVTCSRCGGHLGHVFDDGPKPTGLRYCMNSGALRFEPRTAGGAGPDKK